jgi:hypothetical protein
MPLLLSFYDEGNDELHQRLLSITAVNRVMPQTVPMVPSQDACSSIGSSAIGQALKASPPRLAANP